MLDTVLGFPVLSTTDVESLVMSVPLRKANDLLNIQVSLSVGFGTDDEVMLLALQWKVVVDPTVVPASLVKLICGLVATTRRIFINVYMNKNN